MVLRPLGSSSSSFSGRPLSTPAPSIFLRVALLAVSLLFDGVSATAPSSEITAINSQIWRLQAQIDQLTEKRVALVFSAGQEYNVGQEHSSRRMEKADPDRCDCAATTEQAETTPPLPNFIAFPVIGILVCLSGLFSGLTLGLMGLDINGLKIVQQGDNKELARCATKIAPVREHGNQLLCTLLLGNVAVNSALSILTAEIADGLVGFLASTALIVIFGEILPQAACARYALQVGSATVNIVRCLIALFYIITKPMSIVLDYVLGKEVGTVLGPTELMEMLKLQLALGAVDEAEGAMAQQVAQGAINFRDKQITQVMTPLEKAYMLSTETRLGYDAILEIFKSGFSRVPVYGRDRNDYRGLLYTKDLMLADPEDEMRLGDFIMIFQRKVETFLEDVKLMKVLDVFRHGKTHMGLVRKTDTTEDTNPKFHTIGVITLEDVMEEILQEEIVDETDVYVDVGDQRTSVDRGRNTINLNLGVFNPVWQYKNETLSDGEVQALAAHLERVAFNPGGGFELSLQAIEYLVRLAQVCSRIRKAIVSEAPHEDDWLYIQGHDTDKCTLVLQGRLRVRVGREGFRSESGAFSVLARDALRSGRFQPDFGAFIATDKVRFLIITAEQFQSTKALDKEKGKIADALMKLRVGDPTSKKQRLDNNNTLLAEGLPSLREGPLRALAVSTESWVSKLPSV